AVWPQLDARRVQTSSETRTMRCRPICDSHGVWWSIAPASRPSPATGKVRLGIDHRDIERAEGVRPLLRALRASVVREATREGSVDRSIHRVGCIVALALAAVACAPAGPASSRPQQP